MLVSANQMNMTSEKKLTHLSTERPPKVKENGINGDSVFVVN